MNQMNYRLKYVRCYQASNTCYSKIVLTGISKINQYTLSHNISMSTEPLDISLSTDYIDTFFNKSC